MLSSPAHAPEGVPPVPRIDPFWRRYASLRMLLAINSIAVLIGVAPLAHLDGIHSLKLHGPRLRGSALVVLNNLPQLSALILGVSELNETGIATLIQHPALTTVAFARMELSRHQLEQIGESRRWVWVGFWYCTLTKSDLALLLKIPTLEELTFIQSGVRLETIELLQKQRPNVHIRYSSTR
jgi:hypothetical protein